LGLGWAREKKWKKPMALVDGLVQNLYKFIGSAERQLARSQRGHSREGPARSTSAAEDISARMIDKSFVTLTSISAPLQYRLLGRYWGVSTAD
jgi:hypothetical protein